MINGDTPAHDRIVSDRGGIIENTHQIHAAIVDSKGNLLYTVGNPDRETLLRSAAKPFQALAIVETGALEKFGFDDADLALISASHNSEERHLTRARTMLEKISAKETDLQCGGHPSNSPEVDRGWVRQGIVPTAIHNNCSGKHAGMLAGAKAIGAGMQNYHRLDHPVQKRVKRVVEDLCSGSEAEVRWSIDGCNLPAPAIPLRDIAQIFATLAAAADACDAEGSTRPKRTQNLARVFHAMSDHPGLVAGEGRFCTALMAAFEGSLVGKVGADGCYGVAVRESGRTRDLGAEGALGIGVKVEDGSRDMVYAATVEILEQLQIGSAKTRRQLEAFHRPQRLNTMNVEIGGLSHQFRLRPVMDEDPGK